MNPLEGIMASASELGTVSTKQQRIARLAGQSPAMAFTSLAHLIDVDWLKEAYRRTRKDGAVGVDGMTAATTATPAYGPFPTASGAPRRLTRPRGGRRSGPASRRGGGPGRPRIGGPRRGWSACRPTPSRRSSGLGR
jgi:hypothetical protein